LKKIAVLHDKGEYGGGLAAYTKRFLEKEDRAKIVLFQGIASGAIDYSEVVQKIKGAGTEAIIFGGYPPEASKIVSQIRKKQMKTVFVSGDGVKNDTFIKVIGQYANGVYAIERKDVSKNPMAIAANEAHKKVLDQCPVYTFSMPMPLHSLC